MSLSPEGLGSSGSEMLTQSSFRQLESPARKVRIQRQERDVWRLHLSFLNRLVSEYTNLDS